MEISPNQFTQPIGRWKRMAHKIFDNLQDPTPERFKPSAQRDVGKSASKAAGVQLVIEGLQRPNYTTPVDSMGYLDSPDAIRKLQELEQRHQDKPSA